MIGRSLMQGSVNAIPLTLLGTFTITLVRDPSSGYNIFSAAPDRFYDLRDLSLGTMLGYTTWQFHNYVYEPASIHENMIYVQLPTRASLYTGLTLDSIKAIEVNGIKYPVISSFVNTIILNEYSCLWIANVGELVTDTGNVVKAYG